MAESRVKERRAIPTRTATAELASCRILMGNCRLWGYQ
jgi:hypothetical protein